MDMAAYLKERVEDQLAFYEKAANRAKKTHLWFQTSIIVLGLLVPVVVNLPDQWGGASGPAYLKAAVTVLSLLLAILNGVANFRKHGDLWLSYRMTEELLKHEKFLFLTQSGPYADAEAREARFVQTVESILSAEHNKFRALIEDAVRPTGGAPPSRSGRAAAPAPPADAKE